MNMLDIALAVAAFATGLRAAWLWYRASKVQPDPNWPQEPVAGLPLEPAEPTFTEIGWTSAVLTSMQVSASLNAKAAFWTAVSVVLAAASAIAARLT
jgi:hypothetical protein